MYIQIENNSISKYIYIEGRSKYYFSLYYCVIIAVFSYRISYCLNFDIL